MTAWHTAPSRTRAFYDGISRAYDLIADTSEHAVREIGIRTLGVSSGERVLEIGSGTGHGLVSLAVGAGPAGGVHGLDISSGMMAVARSRIESAGLRNVSLTLGDARGLCFGSGVFDAVFMSFTLELFEPAMPEVLGEVTRVLRMGGRVGIVAMSDSGQTNAMIDLYQWLHRRWPDVIDCRPIDLVGALRMAQFQISTVQTTAIWGLPVIPATGIKVSVI